MVYSMSTSQISGHSNGQFPWRRASSILVRLTASLSRGVATSFFILGLCACDLGVQSEGEVDIKAENGPVSNASQSSENTNSLNKLIESLEIDGDIHDLAQVTDGFLRNSALHLQLAQSVEKELIGLLTQAAEISRKSVREEMSYLIVHRMSTLNPMVALRQIDELQLDNRSALIALTFGEWSRDDLAAAIDHAQTLESTDILIALHGILRSRDDLSDDQQRDITTEMGIKHFSMDMLSRFSRREPVKSPDSMWDEIASDAQSDLSQVGTLIGVAEDWIQRDGLDAIEQIYSSITDWMILMPVLSSALHNATLANPRTTFEHAVQLDFDTGNFLLSSIVQSWATVDPQAALEAVILVESNALQTQLRDSIVRTWGGKDPHGLLGVIDSLPSNLRSTAREHAIVSMSRSDPVTAARILTDLDVGNKKLSIAREVAKNWSDRDAQSALDWVLMNPEVAEIQQELLGVVLGNLVKQDADLAMDIALERPIESNERGLEATVVSYLSTSDPQLAAQMLSKVRGGSTKDAAYTSIGSQLLRTGDVDQALSLADELSTMEQTRYFKSIVHTWALSAPDDLYGRLADLPTLEVKSRAAFALIALNQFRKALTDDQIDAAREFLTDEDRENLDKNSGIVEY